MNVRKAKSPLPHPPFRMDCNFPETYNILANSHFLVMRMKNFLWLWPINSHDNFLSIAYFRPDLVDKLSFF